MPTSPLEAFPTELFILITDHLPDGLAVLRLRHVSRALHRILSSHDIVSHALVTHYPLSLEASYPVSKRTTSVFDAVVRRSYTQPRRCNPRQISSLKCSPLFCSEDDQVLAYQTASQRTQLGEWHCTLWDIQEDVETAVAVMPRIPGCFNERGEMFSSARIEGVWCELGRGVMVVGGKHHHFIPLNNEDLAQGPYREDEVELSNYGIHVAPRLITHVHTFLHVYSLQRPTIGKLLSSFNFYGIGPNAHTTSNTLFLASLHQDSLFIHHHLTPTTTLHHPLLPSSRSATWQDYASLYSTTALTTDTSSNIYIYIDPSALSFYSAAPATVTVISAHTGLVIKLVTLSSSRALFDDCRLLRDDTQLYDWRFRHSAGGANVALSWTGSAGVYGSCGAGRRTIGGSETPIMIEWSITPEAVSGSEHEAVRPRLWFGGGAPTMLYAFEEAVAAGLRRWPVAIAIYVPMSKPEPERVLRWGNGGSSYYTTAGGIGAKRDLEEVEWGVMSVWYDPSSGLDCDYVWLVPRWRSVLRRRNVDKRFVYEGCGWVLYRVAAKRRDWRVEEKAVGGVLVVEYDSEAESVKDEDEDEEILVRGDGNGDQLVLMRF